MTVFLQEVQAGRHSCISSPYYHCTLGWWWGRRRPVPSSEILKR